MFLFSNTRMSLSKLATLIFLSLFAPRMVTASGDDDVALLTVPQLVQEAELGNMHAQYRLAELVYYGAISNWQNYDYSSLLEAAARQGHEFATYDWAREEDLRCWLAAEADPIIYSNCITSAKRFLHNLANQGKAHAYYVLSHIIFREIDRYADDAEIKSRMRMTYLERAAELGSRGGMIRLADSIFSQEPERTAPLLEAALKKRADYSVDDGQYYEQTCTLLFTLYEIYSGQKSRITGQGSELYLDEVDEAGRIRVMIEGRKNSCPLLMEQLAQYYLYSENSDYLEAYIILDQLQQFIKDEFGIYGQYASTFREDYLQNFLAISAIMLDEPEVAKKHLSMIKGEETKEIVFGPDGIAHTFCKSQGVDTEDCENFIYRN